MGCDVEAERKRERDAAAPASCFGMRCVSVSNESSVLRGRGGGEGWGDFSACVSERACFVLKLNHLSAPVCSREGKQDTHGMPTCVGVFVCMCALGWMWMQSRHSAWARCRVSGWKKVLTTSRWASQRPTFSWDVCDVTACDLFVCSILWILVQAVFSNLWKKNHNFGFLKDLNCG